MPENISDNEKTALASVNRTKLISITAIFTALTTVGTIVLKIDFPASGGYFNLGDSIIYLGALLFGPLVGAFAGGIGSMFGDILVGYAGWAPGTLVIKGLEGLIVGYLFKKLKSGVKMKKDLSQEKKVIHLLLGALVSSIIISFGITFFPDGAFLWIFLGFIFIISVIASSFYIKLRLYPFVFSIMFGAIEMIVGYLIYGLFVIGMPEINYGALEEIPINVMQALIGLFIAIPIYQVLYKSDVVSLIEI
ncbi:MAG: ECF transporter S component [Promethearchaeota archaeon]